MASLDGEIERLNEQFSKTMESPTFREKWKEVRERIEILNREIIVKKQGKFVQDKLAFSEGYAYKWGNKLIRRKFSRTRAPKETLVTMDYTESDSSVSSLSSQVTNVNLRAPGPPRKRSLTGGGHPAKDSKKGKKTDANHSKINSQTNNLNIINLTPYPLTHDEKSVLQLGLGFSPSEPINVYETIKDIYLFARNLTYKFIYDKDRRNLNLEKELAEKTKDYSMQEFRALRDLMLLYDEGQVEVETTLEASSTPVPVSHLPTGKMSKRKSSITDFFMKASSKKSHADSASCSTQAEPLLQQAVSAAETTPVSESVVDFITDVAEDTTANASDIIVLPECWDQNQWIEFNKKNPWLFVENGLLGCKLCREIKHLGVSVSQGVSISKEWSTGTITPYGKTKKDMLTSLRKKIHIHRISEAHVKAGNIQAVSRKEILQSNIAEQQKHKFVSTTKVFRTAYFCAKKNRPFTDFPDLISLQVANGADLGSILHSEYTAAQIIDCIASEMRKKLCKAVVEQASKISVYIDESTTVSTHSVLIVYIRASVNGKDPTCLSKFGFSDDFLAKNWIGACSDGASVMLGRKSGVLERLSQKYPQLVKWHCLCHRLELCISDTIHSIPGLHHLTSFFEKLYAVYHQSPKKLAELSECAKGLEVQILKIGKVFSVRWVASSQRAIRAVWESYPALHSHFLKASLSSAHNSQQKSLFSGLNKVLTSEDYLSGEFESLVSEIDILNAQRWPINVDSPWFEGEVKLEQLCKRFRLSYYPSICEGFRDYIDNGGEEIPEKLKPVVTAVNSLPVTSGDCERGFSTMNLVMSPIRSGLGIERLSSLLFISLIGPPDFFL
ncbi:E3 SUMO-protein ligase KIAA1586 homolog [Lithobates pipiens]